jgi:dihydropteroate synthase
VYDDVTRDVVEYLTARAEQLKRRGVERVVLDPGFGFAKTLSQNYELLNGLSDLVAVGYPVLVGVSRKSMIYKALDISQQEALTGTIALHWECLRKGARILRVHDTREAVQTIKLFETYESNR